jgi:hypothetical protein
MKLSAIPTFGPDGSRRRAYSLESVLYFESRKTVYVQRRNGVVRCAHWYGDSLMPLQSRPKAGTRYSHREQVGNHKAWTHQRLPIYRVEKAVSTAEFYAELTGCQAAPFLWLSQSAASKS